LLLLLWRLRVHNLLLLLRCRCIPASGRLLLCVHHLHSLRGRTLHILHLRLLLLRRRWQALHMLLLLCRRRALNVLHLLLLGSGSSTAISIHHLTRHRRLRTDNSSTRGSRQRSHARVMHLLLLRWLLLLRARRGIATCI
jgi:hypothetical protein